MSLILHSTQPTTYAAIERANLQPSTKMQYTKAIRNMTQANVNPMDFNQLSAYADTLSSSSRAFLKAALKLMLDSVITQAQAGATVNNLDQLQTLWHRVQAMNKAIVTTQPEPERLPHWLTQEQVNTILEAAYNASRRDYMVLALLFTAGLRRDELSNLQYSDVATVDGNTVLYVLGKGDKKRAITLPAPLARQLDTWHSTTGDGYIVRSLVNGIMGDSLSAVGIFNIVREYGNLVGITDLAPHDCRRTAGRLMYQSNGNDILEVMHFLGHADVVTTQKYIGLQVKNTTVPMQDFGD